MLSSPLIDRARETAAAALQEYTRHDGSPFIGHPDAVARIVADEIGLPEECIAAVYLHEASRMAGLPVKEADWGATVCTLVEGLNKIATIKPKDTRLEAENYKKLTLLSYQQCSLRCMPIDFKRQSYLTIFHVIAPCFKI